MKMVGGEIWNTSDLLLDYLSIIDQSDNIRQLIGPKTAVKWLKEWGSLDGVIENAGSTPRFGVSFMKNYCRETRS